VNKTGLDGLFPLEVYSLLFYFDKITGEAGRLAQHSATASYLAKGETI
jgi:hypothetical protein